MFATKPGSALPFAIVLASLTALSACGGSDSSSPSASLPIPTTPSPPTTPPPPPPPPPTTPPDPAPPPVTITLAPNYTQLSATVTFSKTYWPDWSHSGSAPIDGVICGPNVVYHIHALVSIYKDGQRLALPGNIGRPSNCDYEMHTHDGSGVVHIETDKSKTFSLGQFFAEWGQPLSAASIAGLPGAPSFYVVDNEKITQVTGDPSTIDLSAHREVLIVTGTPPTQVPRYDWNNSGL